MTPSEQNLLMRQLLIRNSPLINKKLPTVTGAYGGTTRVKLNNTGLLTRLFAHIKLPYNASVAPTSIGNKSVFAAVPKVQLIDFDGSTRINTSAYLLQVINSMRQRGSAMLTANLQSLAGWTSVSAGESNDFREPAISLATGAQTLEFILEIPIAAHVERGDLRGMINAQFTSGDLQLAVDFASLLNGTTDDDFVFNGGTMTLGTPSIDVYQEYYLPQAIQGVLPLPQEDLATVYEIGVFSRTTDNLAAGQEKLLNFPVIREVNAVALDFINNKLLGAGAAANDLSQFVVYANGNNILYQASRTFQCHKQRYALAQDLPQGTYALDFSKGPISTAIFGNVQLAVVPQGTLTTPAVEVCFESIYAKGSTLSGAPV